ncbi:MAG: type VII secretion protein EssC, partial [Clostridia bacterium]|nr:type VII secretion protein EssC [Clostridia bacterium]
RVQHKIEETEIKVLPPQAKKEDKKENILLQVLPTVSMMFAMMLMRSGSGGGSGIMYVFYMAIMAGTTLGISLYNSKKKREELARDNTTRKERYMDYIKRKVEEITTRRQDELRILHRIYRPMDDNVATVTNFDKGLFDRSPGDKDFLDVRLGTGKSKAMVQVDANKQDNKDTSDDLMDIPEEIEAKYLYLDDAPVALRLGQANAAGIVGARKWLYEVLKNMVMDLSIRHYHKELKMYFVLDESDQQQFAWLRWLKNVQIEGSTIRTLLCDEESTKHHLEGLYKTLSEREDAVGNKTTSEKQTWPTYYMVFAYRIDPIRNHPVSQYFEKCTRLGFSFVFMDEYEERIPRGCADMIHLDRKECKGSMVPVQNGEDRVDFRYTVLPDKRAREIAQKLCPVHVVESSLEGDMVKMITLFQLLDIRQVEDIDVGLAWATSRVDKSMAAALGVKTKNQVVALDLHEKAHGPHGLVAGTTGSGKSEIMQTYILNMALQFHPHDVGFMIIDFKGGGMVNQFEKLPHLIGAITNIDGREIDRSLKSIKAELLRRQALFAKYEVNRIDAYILLHKKEPERVPVPLPHLIIIVDEFAELKAEQPDFMKELISAARIGRSLGVHLILATQKPSGVVDDQIWSNSKFKLCLKVQTKEDSQEVLKTPLAAEIREPGRAYLQVGNNELFELFQSAYSGADVPNVLEGEESRKRERIYELNLWGKPALVYDSEKDKSTKAESQLDALVQYVYDYSQRSGVEGLPNICLPPLEQSILLAELTGTEKNLEQGIVVSIAKYDDPEQQYQGDFRLNLSDTNILLVGSAQMGKTTALQTILYSAIMGYTPQEVTFYIIDAGNMALKVFENARHVGGIAMIQEEEKIVNLFKLLHTMINERKEMFAQKGIGTYKAYVEAGLRELPQAVVVIDNIAAFREYYDVLNDELQTLSREGTSVGITFLITASQSNNIGYRTMANFGTRIAFTCNDSSEYGALLGRCRMEPYEYPGRALLMLDKRIVEAQFALCTQGEKEIERMDNLKKDLLENARQYQRMPVLKIPEVPETLPLSRVALDMPQLFNTPHVVPIGMNYQSVSFETVDFNERNYIAVSGKDGAGKSGFVRMLLTQLEQHRDVHPSELYVIDHQKRKLGDVKDFASLAQYTMSAEEAVAIIDKVQEQMEERKQGLDVLFEIEAQEALIASWPMVYVVIQSAKILDHMLTSTACQEKMHKLVTLYVECRVRLIIGEFPNAPISYSSSDLFKHIRDNHNLVFFEHVGNIKPVDIPMSVQRELGKAMLPGDAYYCTGEGVRRLKTITAD